MIRKKCESNLDKKKKKKVKEKEKNTAIGILWSVKLKITHEKRTHKYYPGII